MCLLLWIQSLLQQITWPGLWEFFKVLPGFALFPFSIYLLHKKIGNHVLAQYAYGTNHVAAIGITSVTLINKKDKALTIFGVWIVVDKNVMFEIARLSRPIVLKAMDVEVINAAPYSSAHVDMQAWEMPAPSNSKQIFEVILNTSDGMIGCDTTPIQGGLSYAEKKKYKLARPFCMSFNGFVYTNLQKYAITKRNDKGEMITFFVHKSGFIFREGVGSIQVPKESMESVQTLQIYLDEQLSDPAWSGFRVHSL